MEMLSLDRGDPHRGGGLESQICTHTVRNLPDPNLQLALPNADTLPPLPPSCTHALSALFLQHSPPERKNAPPRPPGQAASPRSPASLSSLTLLGIGLSGPMGTRQLHGYRRNHRPMPQPTLSRCSLLGWFIRHMLEHIFAHAGMHKLALRLPPCSRDALHGLCDHLVQHQSAQG